MNTIRVSSAELPERMFATFPFRAEIPDWFFTVAAVAMVMAAVFAAAVVATTATAASECAFV